LKPPCLLWLLSESLVCRGSAHSSAFHAAATSFA
jgi:hypothetical protein